VSGVPGRHALGFWLSSRKLSTSAYIPSQRSRLALAGRQPFWYNLGFPNTTFSVMAPNSNQDDRITVINDFLLCGMMGSAVDSTGAVNFDFAVQFQDQGKKERWQEVLINVANLCGTAQNPFFLRRPHKINAGSPLICRFQNFHATNNNMPQVTLFGVLGAPH
jgi:hypothetical protein